MTLRLKQTNKTRLKCYTLIGVLWHAAIIRSISLTRRSPAYKRVPQFHISSMGRIGTIVIVRARARAPAHIGASFQFDEEGIDLGRFQQDQSYFASDRVPLRERPVLVHSLDLHRKALNGRHGGRGGPTVQKRSDEIASFSFCFGSHIGTSRKRCHKTNENAIRDT